MLAKSKNPQRFHRYLYALNNPLRLVDLSGFTAQEGSSMTNNLSASLVGIFNFTAGLNRLKNMISKLADILRLSPAGGTTKGVVSVELNLSQIAIEHAKSIEIPQIEKITSTPPECYVDNFETQLDFVLDGSLQSHESAKYVFAGTALAQTSVLINKLTRRVETIFDDVKSGKMSREDAVNEFGGFLNTVYYKIGSR
jgi:hypothetical protein